MSDDQKQKRKRIRAALLIIDVQNRYLTVIPEKEKETAFFFINLLISLFRDNGCPVIRIYHSNDENGPRQGTEEFEYPQAINIRPEDYQIIKTYSDAFNKTNLDDVLKENECNTVFICGFSAVGCVLATRTGARNHDYKAFIVRDAVMSHNSDVTKNAEAMFDAVSFDIVRLIVENS